MSNYTSEARDFLEALADELEVSEARYAEAEKSYKSLGDWLGRDASSLRQYKPVVYVQGSFRLATVIKPLTDDEDYDVDSVCELQLIANNQLSQKQLKEMVGTEVELYRRAQNMVKPLREGRRCWVLNYAEGAQFHMDIVPALPNAVEHRRLLEAHGYSAHYTSTAVVITDNEHEHYHYVSTDWPRSNPKGYALWFRGQMASIFEERRRTLAESIRASVEEIPDYRVRTPLQSAIMILKRHRDIMFAKNMDIRPISIILTTLAAHSYKGEATIAEALFVILTKMDSFIGQNGQGHALIQNPTDPLENFADKWAKHPERQQAFYDWLKQARHDFMQIAALADRLRIQTLMESRVGTELAKRVGARATPKSSGLLRNMTIAPAAAPIAPAFGNQARVPTTNRGFA